MNDLSFQTFDTFYIDLVAGILLLYSFNYQNINSHQSEEFTQSMT